MRHCIGSRCRVSHGTCRYGWGMGGGTTPLPTECVPIFGPSPIAGMVFPSVPSASGTAPDTEYRVSIARRYISDFGTMYAYFRA